MLLHEPRLFLFIVKINKKQTISTEGEPCIDDPNYNYYECFESYFYKKRGCQYPWNVFPHLNLSTCNQFNETEKMVFNKDRNFGYDRYHFGHSERMTRTQMQCPRPCQYTKFHLDYRPWEISDHNIGITFKSIQIGFSDFMIVYSKQYFACDLFCILGQLGGNLGFFLGGSILTAIDLTITGLSMLLQFLQRKQHEK